MKRAISTLLWTLAALIVIDMAVALMLAGPAPISLQRFFDYGRSVPGKLAQWEARPKMRGNLYEVAWLPEMMERSAAAAAARPVADGPLVHAYSMSFVNHILEAAEAARPDLLVARRAGPSAAPNFTYAAFLKDRPNRRAGDVAVLGILSSSVSAMGSFSNRTWLFEQPAPYTYPVFLPDGAGGLQIIEPLVQSLAQQKSLNSDPELARAWEAQLRADDALFIPAAFDLPLLDASPFARLVRRALAQGGIDARKAEVIAHPEDGPMPYAAVLRGMASEFARITREDGQKPLVVLVQSRSPADPDLLALLGPTLKHLALPYLATAEHVSPRDPRAFLGDGHYTAAVNTVFGKALLERLDAAR